MKERGWKENENEMGNESGESFVGERRGGGEVDMGAGLQACFLCHVLVCSANICLHLYLCLAYCMAC
jgi:hypothetical protein